VLLGMADIIRQEGDVARARTLLTAAALNAGERASAWQKIARLARDLGPDGEALHEISTDEAIRINPALNTDKHHPPRSGLSTRITRMLNPDR
jgi:hypothetical protein